MTDAPGTYHGVTLDCGRLVSRAYLRRRVSGALSRSRRLYSLETRRRVMARTVDSAAWMQRPHGETVGSICRAVAADLWREPFS